MFFTIVSIVALCFAASTYAGTLKPGQKMSCNDAKKITLETSGTSSKGDRSNANAVVWLSSSAITVPITLGPGEHQYFKGGAAGAGKVGIRSFHNMGRNKVVLVHQNNFSRGDSIGDISGEVRITNVGTINMTVTCG
jgi:hypothetical protein